MKITDLLGKEVEVNDLDLALMQADDYRHYRHSDPCFAVSDIYLAAYWEDMYHKLMQFKEAP
jgi:hypothetical protein